MLPLRRKHSAAAGNRFSHALTVPTAAPASGDGLAVASAATAVAYACGFVLLSLTGHVMLCHGVLPVVYVQQYKWHEPSREAIEGAFDKLLQVR